MAFQRRSMNPRAGILPAPSCTLCFIFPLAPRKGLAPPTPSRDTPIPSASLSLSTAVFIFPGSQVRLLDAPPPACRNLLPDLPSLQPGSCSPLASAGLATSSFGEDAPMYWPGVWGPRSSPSVPPSPHLPSPTFFNSVGFSKVPAV